MNRHEFGQLAHGLLRAAQRPGIIAAGAPCPAALLVVLFALLGAGELRAQTTEERALDAVRGEIRAVERRLAEETRRRDAEQQGLREAELAIATATAELARIRGRLVEQRGRGAALAADARAATARLAAERGDLARQVRLSYMTGREELAKLVFSQESPATLGRMLVYYDYFNRARTARIGAVSEELATLAALDAESKRIEIELDQLRRAQESEVAALERARGERRAALGELERSITAAGGRIETLRHEEDRLTALIAELAAVLEGFPEGGEEPITAFKGRLAWPLDGAVTHSFGQLRDGGPLRWNGLLLAAPAGTPVRAVYYGRVAFADWLPGLGLLVIVDHGDGYMSLYAHNEALLTESGQWVAPGETIAQVGDSGGQGEAGLYFEIRQGGRPIDPGPWVQARR